MGSLLSTSHSYHNDFGEDLVRGIPRSFWRGPLVIIQDMGSMQMAGSYLCPWDGFSRNAEQGVGKNKILMASLVHLLRVILKLCLSLVLQPYELMLAWQRDSHISWSYSLLFKVVWIFCHLQPDESWLMNIVSYETLGPWFKLKTIWFPNQHHFCSSPHDMDKPSFHRV